MFNDISLISIVILRRYLSVIFLFLTCVAGGVSLASEPASKINSKFNFDNKNGNNIALLLQDERGRKQVHDFMDNVLRQFDSELFLKISDESLNDTLSTNEDVYKILRKRVLKEKPFFSFKEKLSALHSQQTIISNQIERLVPKVSSIKTYVEIGTPGTYINSLNRFYSFDTTYVINGPQSLMDYVHGWSWNPFYRFKSYRHFVALRDYEAISESVIPSNSVDMVTCVIGLHHIPHEKLRSFVESIYRILKPGGIFILRDHDAKDDNTKAIVQTAHSIYNMISSEIDVNDEIAEYRNFQPLDYWINELARVGFKDEKARLFQEGDPTLNAMMKFVKTPGNLADIEESLKNKEGYLRDITQTFLTIPEWQNVLTAEEYAKFIHHTPFYQYPYLASIKSFWDVFSKSWNQARKYKSFFEVVTSDYTVMNLFVGAFMTVEYGLKALISAPIRFLFAGEEPQTIQLLIRDPQNEVMKLSSKAIVLEEFSVDNLKLVEVPRYMGFQKLILTLNSLSNLDIIAFSGNKEIQFTLRYARDAAYGFDGIVGVKKLYDWYFPTIQNEKFTAVLVEAKALKLFLQYLSEKDIGIFYIHDF